MTVDVAPSRRRRASAKSAAPEPTIAPPTTIAIGEIDQTIFECPSCSRPLALGAHRCPGCGTRLVRGVTLGKASVFIAAGLAVGLLVGAGGGLAYGLTQAATRAPAQVGTGPTGAPAGGVNGGGTGTTAPTATATAATSTPRPTTAPTDPAGMPPVTRSALVQVVGTNGRIASAGADLKAALAARPFDSSEVAQILRALSAESVFSQQIARNVGGWTGSAALGADLGTFYDAIHETAANGLVASVRNDAAYRTAATAMLKVLDGMPALDAAVRATAATAGVDLPPASDGATAP